VSGTITPDLFVVDKDSLEIVERRISTKNLEIVPNNHRGTVHKAPELDRRTAPSLTDEEIKHLAKLADTIESHFGKPQDIEFAVDGRLPFPKSVFIVQSRPETVWSFKKRAAEGVRAAPVVKGYPASPGMHLGKAKVVQTTAEAAKLLTKGDILVTRMTNPDWVPYMKIAGSIVTDDGGVTCHAAIVSRELGIPCIVGTRDATRIMQTAQTYTVDAKSGTVFEGIVQGEVKEELEAKAVIPATATAPITATKIYVNLSIPEISDKIARDTNADGVGLLRAEHMMLSVGKHPRLIIEEGGAEKMVESFADGIRQVAEAFHPRPVIYRFLDFKPDEFLGLPGGEKYEREAGHVGPNPMLGYRGCFRYVKEPDIFRLECHAIRKVRDEFGLKNVWVMVPFVRTINEFRTAREIMKEEGLVRNPDFKLWIMVEVPSTVLLIDQFIEEGLDGISFGTNDLCMLVLGIDRNDSIVQEIYDERNPAVLRAMSHVIRKCREKGVTTSVCGQAPSNYPEVVEFLVREGTTSMSVNPDKVIETRHLVASIEQRIILDGFRGKTNGTQLSFKE
jgi:pyruvate,water dikinase